MIHVNLSHVDPGAAWEQRSADLTHELLQKPENERSNFIKVHRDDTWGHHSLLQALQSPVGNKCWYSESPLVGADPNVDHFRPKGRVREVDTNLQYIGIDSPGYWWLAFELRNFRLASMHSNQRRVDVDTDGGKSDYFPVLGARALERTLWLHITENVLPLDPCSVADVSLLWFDLDGNPCCSLWRGKTPSAADRQRVRVTIWLYHLDKSELQIKRASHVRGIRADLKVADAEYRLWNFDSTHPDLQSKNRFDLKCEEIRAKLADNAEFAGAKRGAARNSIAEYPWIDQYILL